MSILQIHSSTAAAYAQAEQGSVDTPVRNSNESEAKNFEVGEQKDFTPNQTFEEKKSDRKKK